MMNSQLFGNLLSWSAQISILAMAGAAGAFALRHPRARLYFWQTLLAIALMLPVIAPWKRPLDVALVQSAPVALTIPAVAVSRVPPTSTAWGFEQLAMLLAAGAAFRLVWVAAGLLRLARIRKHARPLQTPPVAFGGSASWYVSDQVTGPVTFGWLRPSILLPARMSELPPSAQEAIASHELFHVHRRDWLFVMAEELIRSVLWFQPAVWFVLSRIQLAREQVVDQEVVDATRDRTGYLDALVSVAAQRLQADVAPAPLFLKKRQLAARVQALLKETSMSASRLAAHVSVAASVAVLGACAAIWFFPLRSAAQVLPDDPGITVDAGATLAHRTPVHNPTTAMGDVLLELKLNSKGEVADARVLSGPDELRKAALASVLDWHYVADTAPPSLVHAMIHFGQPSVGRGLAQAPPPPPPPPPPPGRGAAKGLRGGLGAGLGTGLGQGVPPPPPPPPPPLRETAVVQRIEYAGLSPELQQRIQNRLTIREGDTLEKGGNGLARIQEELQQIDEHLAFRMTLIGRDAERANVILEIVLRPGIAPQPASAALPVPPGVYRIGGGVSAPIPTLRPEPEYSEEARRAKWQGAVLLQVVIDENGVPQDIRVARSVGLGLDEKAIEAVQQWRFKPGLKDGKAVPVSANIEVNFRIPSADPVAMAAPASKPITVGGRVMESRVVQRIPPVYPANARTARVQGTVQLSVTIGPDGRVQDVQALSGPAMLTQAAVQAVAQWVYQPFLLNGQAVSVQTTADVNFVLE
jgi:TonB family protein